MYMPPPPTLLMHILSTPKVPKPNPKTKMGMTILGCGVWGGGGGVIGTKQYFPLEGFSWYWSL